MNPTFIIRHLSFVILAALLTACTTPHPAPKFFTVTQQNGTWWFLDPDNKPFLSKGVTTVSYAQDNIKNTNRSPHREANEKKYGSLEAWRSAATARLIDWNFNTLGAWSDPELAKIDHNGKKLAYSINLDLGNNFVNSKKVADAWLQGVFPDVFDPAFTTFANTRALELCTPHKSDPQLLGYFTDNELRWAPDWRGHDELLTLFLNLPQNAPGKTAAINLLQSRHKSIAAFNTVWHTTFPSWNDLAAATNLKSPFATENAIEQNHEARTNPNADPDRAAWIADCDAFLAILAEKYFATCTAAIRNADPNHLVFGCRFAYVPPAPVIAAAAKHLDVISLNCYRPDPSQNLAIYAAYKKPLLIGEFSFRGQDAGLPNNKGAGPKVPTQSDRAKAMQNYLTKALANPNLVGYHWFEHADEPKEGRFDGEDSNYGLVNINDTPYPEITTTFTHLNAQAESLHTPSK